MKLYVLIICFLFLFSCKKDSVLSLNGIINDEIVPDLESDDIKDTLLIEFYKKNDFQFFWKDSTFRNKMIKTVEDIENEGLFLKDFDINKINTYEKKVKSLNKEELVVYDVLLTKNLKKYIQLGFYGKVNPSTFYKDWDLEKDSTAIERILNKFVKNKNIDSLKYNVLPNHPVYIRLKKSYQEFKNIETENIIEINFTQKYLPDSVYSGIIDIKKRLVYKKEMYDSINFNKKYDSLTVIIVKSFQKKNNLEADGIIGQSTIDALNLTKDKKKKQIIANMERWRWYPRKLSDNYVLVNLPQFMLWTLSNKDTISTHKVIIGKITRKTPILSSLIDKVTFNPTWTVPPTILKEDLKPAATRNRNYFKRKGLTIYKNGKMVSPDNWNPNKASNYSYVQNPGRSNALGIVKLGFKNRFLVYLHDTSNRKLYANTQRALSSGCVRVDEPLKLTEVVINDTLNYSKDSIEKIISKKRTKQLKIDSKFMVYQWYWTADYKNGKSIFYNDVYRLDQKLYEAMVKN